MWIGSADLMPRNLDRRVEALVRVEEPDGGWHRIARSGAGKRTAAPQSALRGDRRMRGGDG